ncbi:MAG: HK97 family phage prohead protease [Hyphomicrobiaceae bacterium]|nr:HK97 family phage prohead protease [Hyphomicrobiaceae bacterium]
MKPLDLLSKDYEFDGRRLDATFHVKAEDVTPEGRFKGYASVFGIIDQGGDVVQPGAFIESIAQAKSDNRLIPMLWQHDRTEPLGTWVDMAEDAKGLYVEGQLVLEDNPPAKRALALLRAKAIGGMSIGYRIPAAGAEEDPKRRGVYLLKKLNLIEISLVTMPMLLQARVQSVKSLIAGGVHPTERDLVGVLLEVGFAEELAKSIGEVARPLLADGQTKGIAPSAQALYDALAARLLAAG